MDRLYALLHFVLIGAYVLAPPAAILAGLLARRRAAPVPGETPAFEPTRRRRPTGPIASVVSTLIAGAAMGGGLVLVYAQLIAGSWRSASITQMALAVYFGMGLLVLIKGLDLAGRWMVSYIRRRLGTTVRPSAAIAMFLRLALLVLVALPIVMAAVMTYRPKAVPPVDPLTEIGERYERVAFEAADGTALVGWWLPPNPGVDESVIIAHGLGSGKADMLVTARHVRRGGYGVLLFDLRAHGESGGQLTSFGLNETMDVEAAVAWLRASKPEATERIFGLGASMGAAAMVSATNEEGRSPFDALAVLGGYDDLGEVAEAMVARQFAPPMNLVALRIALPAASLHTGRQLSTFRPADGLAAAWPTPVLVVHGRDDEVIPFACGRRLYESAFEPRRHWWVDGMGHNEILTDADVLNVVLGFFDETGLKDPDVQAIVRAE